MSATVGAGNQVVLNLTPMLDVVFQLITFFIMLANFSQANISEKVHLPISESAKPVEAAPADVLTINIDRQGRMLVVGEQLPVDSPRADRFLHREAEISRVQMKAAGQSPDQGLWTTIQIRADKDLPYDDLHRLIRLCQKYGFTKFALRAMTKG